MKNLLSFYSFIALVVVCQSFDAQTIQGFFPQLKGASLELVGYDGFKEKPLASTVCDEKGHMSLTYPKDYIGAAMLKVKDGGGFLLVLHNENMRLAMTDLQNIESLTYENSNENDVFKKGIFMSVDTGKKIAALQFLSSQYQSEPDKYQWLLSEKAYQESIFDNYLSQLPKDSYAGYYMKIRRILENISRTTDQKISEEHLIKAEGLFKKIDFADERLWHTGLMEMLVSGFYLMLENYGDADKTTRQANLATDVWMKNLEGCPQRQQEMAEYVFKVAELKSLFGVSEHVAIAMLGQKNCTLTEKRASLFEQHRKLALGNTAPDIDLGNGKKLSSLSNPYKLVIFGESQCPNCQADYPTLSGIYRNMKDAYKMEAVYIALDTDKKLYDDFYRESPFTMIFGGHSFDTVIAKEYYVSGTPTYLLLDQNMKILTKPKSPKEIEEWLKNNHKTTKPL